MKQPPGALRGRPNMPHYGVQAGQPEGMLPWGWVERQLTEAQNYWLCCRRGDGSPHCSPVWGLWQLEDCAFYFGAHEQSVKARSLARDERAVLHLESGQDVVILEGKAQRRQPPASIVDSLNASYEHKYSIAPGFGQPEAPLFAFQPQKVLAWKENDFPTSATAWHFRH